MDKCEQNDYMEDIIGSVQPDLFDIFLGKLWIISSVQASIKHIAGRERTSELPTMKNKDFCGKLCTRN